MALKAAAKFIHRQVRKQSLGAIAPLLAAQDEARRIEAQKAANKPELAAALAESLTEWAKPLLQPKRYKCLYGGRGSGKSYGAVDALLIEGLRRPIRVLCAREIQNSIKESVHYLLKQRISDLGLESHYTVQEAQILGANGTIFVFKGIRYSVDSIKSMAALTHCWIEEAQTISAESWRILIPTIREEGSEVWVTFNPRYETDTVWQELVAKQRDNAYVRRVNWKDNPHFTSVLDEERRSMLATDPDAYDHIWEGGFWQKSDAQILKGKWVVADFEPGEDWDGPYLGSDFGFASSPTTLVKLWVHANCLYVERESYAKGLEIDDTTERWLEDVPGCDRHIIRADCARPESISYLKRNGIPRITACVKGKGSIEDGIAHLRSYDKIVIHTRCTNTAEEARLWSYKVDRLTEEVLDDVIDAYNHCWDAIRYALEPVMKARKPPKRHLPSSYTTW